MTDKLLPKDMAENLTHIEKGLASFGYMSERQIKNIILDFKGIEKAVYEYIKTLNSYSETGLNEIIMEMHGTGDDFISTVLNHGLIRQDELTDISLKLNPDELANKTFVEPSIPPSVLKQYKILISSIDSQNIYLSTLGSKYLAKRVIKEYFPYHNCHFTSAKPETIFSYIEDVERYSQQTGSLLEVIVRKAIREKMSDIHVYPSRNGYNIKTRYLGQLYVERVGDQTEYNQLIAKAKTNCGLDSADRLNPQDGSFSIPYNGRLVDLRVATCPVLHNKETMVIRILDPENSQVDISELGITEVNEFKKAINSDNGVVLICGVTGSGKTTTTTSVERTVLDRYKRAINTIEDPVENEVNDIKQTQVNTRTGLTFSKVLRSILRQDPDVIVVGEVRDEETAEIMFMGADTGHLLIGTLHVKDIKGVLLRLEALNIEKDKILNQLKGILVQKLIRVVCKNCHGSGCDECSNKGYTSRTVVSECVYLNDREDVDRLFSCKKPWWNTVIDDAYMKYRKGITDRNEMLNAFGSTFQVYEEKQAMLSLDQVKTGELSHQDYLNLFPVHEHLLRDVGV